MVPSGAAAHAGLLSAAPAVGATLGATPKAVLLSFSEQPEPALSEIRVLAPGGSPVRTPRAMPAAGDPLSLEVPLPTLPRGVYTVSWKIVSAVDAHATSGTYEFGVRQSPSGAAVEASTTPSSSGLELVARLVFLLGIVALLGGAVAAVARFGGRDGSDLALACGGWLAALAGLALLAEAQRRTAGSSFGALFDTDVGAALIRRGVALAAAGLGLLLAWRAPRLRRGALAATAVATLVAIVFHVAAGHAAAGSWAATVTVAAQAAHFAAAGIWFGGLAALLLGIRGAPSAQKAAAVRRFAVVALSALIVVFATGVLRAVDELASWGELLSSGYGRAILAKLVLIALIVALAWRNRSRGVPRAATDLTPLRRSSTAELTLAIAALAVAALLGTLAPPVSGQTSELGDHRLRRRLRDHHPGRADHGVRRTGTESLQPEGRGLRLGRPGRGRSGRAALHPDRRPRGGAVFAEVEARAGWDLRRLGGEPDLRRTLGDRCQRAGRRRGGRDPARTGPARPAPVRLCAPGPGRSPRSTRCRSARSARSGSNRFPGAPAPTGSM